MNRILSRILGWLGFSVQNTYEGARWNGERSWLPSSVQSARLDINTATRSELVRKSRYFEKNSGIYNRLADIFEIYTAGSGLALTPASSDANWNSEAKVWWDDWSRYCDLSSLQGLGSFQSLMARAWFVDGEVFVNLTRGTSGRPRIQLIEAQRVSTPPDLAEFEGTSIIDGVRIDANGRPVGYYVSNEKAKPTWEFLTADYVVHLFEPSRPGQYRGIPFIHPVLNDLHDLDDLEILEMRAARDGGEKSVFITTESGELPTGAELWRRRASMGTQTATGTATTENLTEYYKKSVGGRTVALRKGEDVKQFAPARPTVVTMEYWRQKQAKICAGVGIPYVLVFPESMQGTVYRGALDMADGFFRSRSAVLQEATRRFYEYAMNWATKQDLARPADWFRCSIQPPRSVNVDVGYNASAVHQGLEDGTLSLQMVVGPTGNGWRELVRQKAEEAKFIRETASEFGLEPYELSRLIQDMPERIKTEPVEPVPAKEDAQ